MWRRNAPFELPFAQSGSMTDRPIVSLTLRRSLRAIGVDDEALRRAIERQELIRVHRGAYAHAKEWAGLPTSERYVWKVVGAVAASRTAPIISHLSAAAVHGAPIIGRPSDVHVLATFAAGTRTEHGFRKHATRHLDVGIEERGALRLTDLPRTLAEVASDASFLTAVGILDWALASSDVTKDEVREQLDLLGIRRGRVRAERAIEFADGRSESPGESLSRVRMHELGFPAPVLQQDFRDPEGLIGRVDFWWPDHELIGEFDGTGKYLPEAQPDGRKSIDALMDEKKREDRFRATGRGFARWMWEHAWQPYRLGAILHRAGLRSARAAFL
jgi:hypothetical protein